MAICMRFISRVLDTSDVDEESMKSFAKTSKRLNKLAFSAVFMLVSCFFSARLLRINTLPLSPSQETEVLCDSYMPEACFLKHDCYYVS